MERKAGRRKEFGEASKEHEKSEMIGGRNNEKKITHGR